MKDKDWGVVKTEINMPKYAARCLICGEIVRIYDEPTLDIAICEDCKKAVAFAKELLKEKEELEKKGGVVLD